MTTRGKRSIVCLARGVSAKVIPPSTLFSQVCPRPGVCTGDKRMVVVRELQAFNNRREKIGLEPYSRPTCARRKVYPSSTTCVSTRRRTERHYRTGATCVSARSESFRWWVCKIARSQASCMTVNREGWVACVSLPLGCL
ncbi:hypothetical protein SESBI_42412 [Sesbania bispinosa]|nr:hypothetical protein SESBI_42412 [Sesbania bispinosa]